MVQGETSEELRCLSSLGHEELTDSELVLQAASILAPSHAQDMDICSAAPHRRGSAPSRDSSASVQSASPQLQRALAAQPGQPAGQAALSLVKIESGTESQVPLAVPTAARPCPAHATGLGKAGLGPAVHSLAPEHLPMLPASHPQVKQEAAPATAGPEAAAEDNDGKGIKRNRTHQKDYTQRKRVLPAPSSICLPHSTPGPELLQQPVSSLYHNGLWPWICLSMKRYAGACCDEGTETGHLFLLGCCLEMSSMMRSAGACCGEGTEAGC